MNDIGEAERIIQTLVVSPTSLRAYHLRLIVRQLIIDIGPNRWT